MADASEPPKEDFSVGPLSVLQESVKKNCQVLIAVLWLWRGGQLRCGANLYWSERFFAAAGASMTCVQKETLQGEAELVCVHAKLYRWRADGGRIQLLQWQNRARYVSSSAGVGRGKRGWRLILTTPLERRRGGRGPGDNRIERGISAERHRLDLVLSSQQAGIVHGMRRDTHVVVFQYLLLMLIPTVLPTPIHEFQFDLFSSHTHERERNFLYTIPCHIRTAINLPVHRCSSTAGTTESC